MAKTKDNGGNLYLFCAIHAAFFSVPSLILSLLSLPNPINDLLFPPTVAHHAVLASNAGRTFYELFLFIVAVFAHGYFRLYRDGPSRQPLILFSSGVAKIFVAIIIAREFFHGSLTVFAVIAVGISDFVLGVLFLRDWKDLGFALNAVSDPGIKKKN